MNTNNENRLIWFETPEGGPQESPQQPEKSTDALQELQKEVARPVDVEFRELDSPFPPALELEEKEGIIAVEVNGEKLEAIVEAEQIIAIRANGYEIRFTQPSHRRRAESVLRTWQQILKQYTAALPDGPKRIEVNQEGYAEITVGADTYIVTPDAVAKMQPQVENFDKEYKAFRIAQSKVMFALKSFLEAMSAKSFPVRNEAPSYEDLSEDPDLKKLYDAFLKVEQEALALRGQILRQGTVVSGPEGATILQMAPNSRDESRLHIELRDAENALVSQRIFQAGKEHTKISTQGEEVIAYMYNPETGQVNLVEHADSAGQISERYFLETNGEVAYATYASASLRHFQQQTEDGKPKYVIAIDPDGYAQRVLFAESGERIEPIESLYPALLPLLKKSQQVEKQYRTGALTDSMYRAERVALEKSIQALDMRGMMEKYMQYLASKIESKEDRETFIFEMLQYTHDSATESDRFALGTDERRGEVIQTLFEIHFLRPRAHGEADGEYGTWRGDCDEFAQVAAQYLNIENSESPYRAYAVYIPGHLTAIRIVKDEQGYWGEGLGTYGVNDKAPESGKRYPSVHECFNALMTHFNNPGQVEANTISHEISEYSDISVQDISNPERTQRVTVPLQIFEDPKLYDDILVYADIVSQLFALQLEDPKCLVLLQKAKEILQKQQKKYPKMPYLFNELAELELVYSEIPGQNSDECLATARKLLDKAIAIAPGHTGALLQRMDLNFREARMATNPEERSNLFRLLSADLESVLDNNGSNESAMEEITNRLKQFGLNELVRDVSLNMALKHPKEPMWLHLAALAIIDLSNPDLRQAYLICEQALRLNPEDHQMQAIKAHCLVQLGLADRGVREYEKVMDKMPNNLLGKIDLIYAWSQIGNDEKVQQNLKDTVDDLRSAQDMAVFVSIVSKNPNMEFAIHVFEYVLDVRDPDQDVIGNLSYSYMALDKPDKVESLKERYKDHQAADAINKTIDDAVAQFNEEKASKEQSSTEKSSES